MFFAEGAARAFGGLDVLSDVSFVIGDGERVGLVGPNGSGKSTLLRLLAGEDQPDSGTTGYRGLAVGYLRQEASLASSHSLLGEMWTAFPEARSVDRRLQENAARIERVEGDLDDLVDEQGELFHRFEALDGYRLTSRISRVLKGLGFEQADAAKLCGEFSGGWQMRIALAKALVRRPDNLLLDEPTNHLDAASHEWLGGELAAYRGTLLIVTHDGDFLDRVASRILELRDGRVESYAGNYSDYQSQKAERLQQQDRRAARQEREIARQERFIERFHAKSSKATLVKSREKALAKVERLERPRRESEVHIQLSADGRTEKDVLLIRHAPNGSGKTTLLRIAAGHLKPQVGSVRWAEKARPAYYDQHQDEALDAGSTVLDEVLSVAGGQPEARVRTVLGQFLFRGDDVFKRISVLSGGERSRVALAKLVITPTNVLVLDEPTNAWPHACTRCRTAAAAS